MTKIKIFMKFPQRLTQTAPLPCFSKNMLKSDRKCGIICLSVFSVREEVETVIYIIDLVLSVVGSVVGNLITKWFGRKK